MAHQEKSFASPFLCKYAATKIVIIFQQMIVRLAAVQVQLELKQIKCNYFLFTKLRWS